MTGASVPHACVANVGALGEAGDQRRRGERKFRRRLVRTGEELPNTGEPSKQGLNSPFFIEFPTPCRFPSSSSSSWLSWRQTSTDSVVFLAWCNFPRRMFFPFHPCQGQAQISKGHPPLRGPLPFPFLCSPNRHHHHPKRRRCCSSSPPLPPFRPFLDIDSSLFRCDTRSFVALDTHAHSSNNRLYRPSQLASTSPLHSSSRSLATRYIVPSAADPHHHSDCRYINST